MKKTISALVTSIALFAPFAASASTTSITHTLSLGSRGEEVTTLQELLVELGMLKATPSGYFGNMTRIAVLSFQRANGLGQVGSVGPKTRMVLNTALARKFAANQSTTTTQGTVPPAAQPVTPAQSPTTVVTPPPPMSPVTTDIAPLVTLVAPLAPVSRSATDFEFAVSTDKPATCRYGTQPNMKLSDMASFIDTLGTKHSRTLTGLSSGGLYIYYVRCEDSQNRSSNELQVTISLTGN